MIGRKKVVRNGADCHSANLAIYGGFKMYLNIKYRDGSTEQLSVDDISVRDGCLMYYIRFGVNAGRHYIPMDIIKEFHKEN